MGEGAKRRAHVFFVGVPTWARRFAALPTLRIVNPP
jgi:hypothetical protein